MKTGLAILAILAFLVFLSWNATAIPSSCCYQTSVACNAVSWRDVLFNADYCKRFYWIGDGSSGPAGMIIKCQPHRELWRYPLCKAKRDADFTGDGSCTDNFMNPPVDSCRNIPPEKVVFPVPPITIEPPFINPERFDLSKCSEFYARMGEGLGTQCMPNPNYSPDNGEPPCIEGLPCVSQPCDYEPQEACNPRTDCNHNNGNPDNSDDSNSKCGHPPGGDIDLTIDSVIPVQVINNPPHFVEDKGIVVRVGVGLGRECKEKEGVEVKLKFNGYEEIKSANILSEDEYSNNQKKLGQDTVNFFIPVDKVSVGTHKIEIELDPDDKIKETNECNNKDIKATDQSSIVVKSQSFSMAKNQLKLDIKWIPVRINHPTTNMDGKWDTNYGKAESKLFTNFKTKTIKPMADIYPVSKRYFKFSEDIKEFPPKADRAKYSYAIGNIKPDAWALLKDLNVLAKKDKTADRYVGVTPSGWVSVATGAACGITRTGYKAVLVDTSCSSYNALHELGHTFGLYRFGEEYTSEVTSDKPYGNPIEGGWNYAEGDNGAKINIDKNNKPTIESAFGIKGMPKYFCMMGTPDQVLPGGRVWIDNADYIKLLNQMTK